jgi:hypothetical protein
MAAREAAWTSEPAASVLATPSLALIVNDRVDSWPGSGRRASILNPTPTAWPAATCTDGGLKVNRMARSGSVPDKNTRTAEPPLRLSTMTCDVALSASRTRTTLGSVLSARVDIGDALAAC